MTRPRPSPAKSARARPDPGSPRRTARSGRVPAWSFRAAPAVRLRSSPQCYAISSPMSFLDHIARCNNADLSQFEPWFIGKTRAGFIHRDFTPRLGAPLFAHRDEAWYLDLALDTPDKRTAAMHTFLLKLRAEGLFGSTWREEPY